MLLKQLFESEQKTLTPIYRGMNIRGLNLGERIPDRPIRKNRRPTDSDKSSSALFNYGIELLLGIEEIRKRSIFGSTDKTAAMVYAEESNYRTGGMVQLIIDSSATVVYNPNVADSFDLFQSDLMSRCWPESMARRILSENNPSFDDEAHRSAQATIPMNKYARAKALPFLMSLFDHLAAAQTLTPEELTQRRNAFQQDVKEAAVEVVQGYKQTTVGAFVNPPLCECIITNAADYSGRVVKLAE